MKYSKQNESFSSVWQNKLNVLVGPTEDKGRGISWVRFPPVGSRCFPLGVPWDSCRTRTGWWGGPHHRRRWRGNTGGNTSWTEATSRWSRLPVGGQRSASCETWCSKPVIHTINQGLLFLGSGNCSCNSFSAIRGKRQSRL